MRTLPSAVLASVLIVAACSSDTQAPGTNDPQPLVAVFRADSGSTVLLDWNSALHARANYVVTDVGAWLQLWEAAHATMEPRPETPGIDFGEDGVIAAALGDSPSPAYTIHIDSVQYFEASQKVYVTRATGERCLAPAVIANPVHMVRVPRPLNNVTFEERSAITSCAN